MYIFLVELFHNLGPASLLGLSYTLAGFLFAGWVGGLVDGMSRLKFVRLVITIRKVCCAAQPCLDTDRVGPLDPTVSQLYPPYR